MVTLCKLSKDLLKKASYSCNEGFTPMRLSLTHIRKDTRHLSNIAGNNGNPSYYFPISFNEAFVDLDFQLAPQVRPTIFSSL